MVRLGPCLKALRERLSEAGYATITARQHLRAAEHFIYWTDRHGMPVRKLNEQSLARFDRHLSRCHCSTRTAMREAESGPWCAPVPDLPARCRIITLPSVEPPVHDPALLSAFCQWMRQQRGTGDVTLCHYSIYIRELLRRLGEDPSRFDARRLRAFVLEKSRSCGWGNDQKLHARRCACSCVS